MSNLKILEQINKYKSYKNFSVTHKNQIKDGELYICKIEKQDRNDLYIGLAKEDTGYDEIRRKNDTDTYVPLLNPYMERWAIYCAGKAGDGKGVFISDLARQYHIILPKNRIFYICSTPIQDDINFSKQTSYIQQFNINAFEGQSEERIMKFLKNSLVIMDDCDNLPKEEKDILNSVQKSILFLGRKFQISLFKISHYKTNANDTRALIPELDYYINFVNRDLESDRLLNTYKKISKSTLKELKNSIWAFWSFKYEYVITNNKILFID